MRAQQLQPNLDTNPHALPSIEPKCIFTSSLQNHLILQLTVLLVQGCAVQDTLCRRKRNFLTKLKYKTTSNLLYHAVQKVALDELAELQKII